MSEPTPHETQTPHPRLKEAAFTGLAGDFVRRIESQTEADPIALLLQFLVAFGNAVGPRPFTPVDGVQHHMNLFAVLVGRTARSRKGTSWAWVKNAFFEADPAWARTRIQSGLTSGQSLVHAVRDPAEIREPLREKGRVIEYQTVVRDFGCPDKRLLVLETEFAFILNVMRRSGNTLSALLRDAWNSDDLHIAARREIHATAPHVSVIAHITRQELRILLQRNNHYNGFANRFLWLTVERSRLLAEGGWIPESQLRPLHKRLAEALAYARDVDLITRDKQATGLWRNVYNTLARDNADPESAITARAEAQVLRLSALYALLDGTNVITMHHLIAALCLWEYCDESARHIFGDGPDDPIANQIFQALKTKPDGLTQTEIYRRFSGRVSADRIALAFETLEHLNLVIGHPVPTGGRPATIWCLREPDPPEHRSRFT